MFVVRRKRVIPVLAILLGVAVFYLSKSSFIVSPKEEYVEFINNHPFAERNIDYRALKNIPKKDRPDLALEHNFLQIVDPVLKRVPSERLVIAFGTTQKKLDDNPSKINFRKSSQPKRSIFEGPAGKVPNAAIPNVNWTERGPDNVGGRTRSLMWDPNDPNTTKVWAGSVSGGLWFNNDITDGNSSWIAVDDFLTSLSISSIIYDPTDLDVYYVGTGEGYIAGNTGGGVPGAGLYKSSDAGATWDLLPSTTGPDFRYIQKVVVTPAGTVIVSTRESINEGGQPGIYRSTDGGNTWANVLNEGRGGDIELASNGDIYAAVGIGSGSGTLHRSTDDGLTWTDITPPGGNPLRIELDVAPSASSSTVNTVIYTVAQDASTGTTVTWFQRSDDGGETWTDLDIPEYREQNCSTNGTDFTRGQSFYDLIITVKPDNPDILTLGGINVLRSSNAGVTTSEVSYWTGGCDAFVHADQHEAVFRPGFPNEAVFGHDGGVSYSTDFGSSSNPSFVTRNKNYRVTQFYAVAADNVAGSGYFLAGSQDNGTQRFTAANGSTTTEATGGDGGFTHIDQTDRNYQVTSFTGNTVNHSSNGGESFSNIVSSSAGLFINPTDLDNESHTLYSAGNNGQLLRIKNINTNSPDDQETLSLSVGQISHIRANANEPNRIFVGSRQGDIYRIDNANQASPTVTNITNNITSTGNVSSIDIGSNDNQLIATFSNYGVVSVWLSTDGGENWVSKDEAAHGLPDIPVRWSIFNPNNTSQVLLATELGIWSTNDILADNPGWEPSVNNLANVRCDMLQYREADQTLVLATFGRGVYTSNVFSSTIDTTPPVIISLNPADDSNEILLDVSLEVTFNEPILKGSGAVQILRSLDDSEFETIDISNTTTSSSTLLINPSTDFEPLTDYYILIDDGAIVDNSANNFGGVSDKTVWNFETFDGDFPPTVANPLEDIRSVRDDQLLTIDIDVSNVFDDVDNDNSAITKDVTINTNPSLVTAVVNGNTLTLSIEPNLIGIATLTLEGNSNGKTAEDIFILEVGDAILIDQTDNAIVTTIISMQMTDRADTIVQSADDFIVPDGKLWTLTAIDVSGSTVNQIEIINEFRVEIYADDQGEPDDSNLIYEETIAATWQPGQTSLRLPISVDLVPGNYWVSVLSISPIGTARWNWRTRSITNEGFYLNDRLGFFGLEPNVWLPGGEIDSELNYLDFVFSLEGDSVTATQTPGVVTVLQSKLSEVTVQWADNSDNETGFSVERSSSPDSDFIEIGSVGAGETSFTDDSFQTNALQYYRVRAMSDINSAYTDPVAILTIPAAPTLNPVEDFINNSFTVSWVSPDGASGFELDVSSDNFSTFLTDLEGLVLSGRTSFEVTNVDKGIYQFRVRAANESGVSESSEVGTTEVITSLGGSLENTFKFQMYPVPTTAELNIKLPEIFKNEVDVQVYNLKGALVYERNVKLSFQKEISISTSMLNEGVYMITFSNKSEFAQAQFIKVQ